MDKEKWINETLESLNGIKKVEPNPFLFPKILSRLKSGEKVPSFIPVRKIAFGFLSLALLAVLNVSIWFMNGNGSQQSQVTETTASELIPSQTNPYLEILTSY